MNWSEEPYVKLFKRQTVTWRRWPWEARAIFPQLLQVAEPTGRIDTGKGDPLGAIAILLVAPREVVEPAVAALLESDTLQAMPDGTGFVITNYVAASESRKTDKLKKADQRLRDRAKHLDIPYVPVTESHPESPAVTDGHQLSPPAQPSPAQPISAQPSPSQPSTEKEKLLGPASPEPLPLLLKEADPLGLPEALGDGLNQERPPDPTDPRPRLLVVQEPPRAQTAPAPQAPGLTPPKATPGAEARERLKADFKEVTGHAYLWQGAKDDSALATMLRSTQVPEISRRWRLALSLPETLPDGRKNWKAARTIATLGMAFNDLATAVLPVIPLEHRPSRRL